MALILSGVSILSFLLSIQKDITNKEEKIGNDSIALFIRNIQLYETIPLAPYNVTLYPKELIDSIQNDYDEMNGWMEQYAENVRNKMSKKELINIDSIQIPFPKSSVANKALFHYRNKYVALLSRYNKCVKELNGVNNKKNKHTLIEILLNYVIPLILIISILLS